MKAFLLFLLSCYICLASSGRALESASFSHFDMGNQLYVEGNLHYAVTELKKVDELSSDYLATKVLLAKIYLEQNKGGAAEKELIKAREGQVSQQIIQPLLLQAYLLQNQYQSVLELALPVYQEPSINSQIYAYRGQAYESLNQDMLAIDAYQEALKLHPDNAPALIGLATIFVNKNDMDSALSFLEQVLSKQETNAAALLLKANIKFQQGHTQEVASLLDKLLAHYPKNSQGILMRAALLIEQGDYSSALLDIDLVLQKWPRETMARYLQLVSLEALGEITEAEKIHQNLLQLLSQLPLSLKKELPVIYYLLGLISYRGEAYEQANKYLSKYLKINRSDVVALKLLANVRFELGEFFLARKLLEEALFLSPRDAEVNKMLGYAHLMLGRYQRAKYFFQVCLEIDPTNRENRNDLAKLALQENDYEAALSYVLAPDITAGSVLTYESLFIIAKSYLELNQLETGIKYVHQLLKVAPDDSYSYLLFGSYSGLLGQLDIAMKSYQMAISLDENNFQAVIHLARLEFSQGLIEQAESRLKGYSLSQNNSAIFVELGNLYISQKQPELALQYYLKALAINPESYVSSVNAAAILEHKNELDGALSILTKSVKSTVEYPQVFLQKAQIQFKLGQQRSALTTLNELTNYHGEEASIWLKRAKLLLANHQQKHAITALKHAVLLNPTFLQAYELLIIELSGDHQIKSASAYINSLELRDSEPAFVARLYGHMHRLIENWRAAEEYYLRSLQLEFSEPSVVGLYQVYVKLGEIKKGAKVLERALIKTPNNVFMLLALADSREQLGQFDKVESIYQRALKAHPNHPVVLNNAAQLYLRLNELHLAKELALRAFEVAPDWPEIIDTLGWIYALEEEYEAALPLLRKAELLKFNDENIQYHLAYVMSKMGKVSEAQGKIREWQEAHPNRQFSRLNLEKPAVEKLFVRQAEAMEK